MKIKVNLKIFIFIIIFLITGQLKIYGILMLFAFLHEMGHLLAGVVLKFNPESIKIMPLGLVVSFNVSSHNHNEKILKSNSFKIKKIVIALAGPITNIVIFILLIYWSFGLSIETRIICIYSNILIAIFNLLPIYPLDGGRVVKGLLSIYLNKLDSIKWSNIISNVTLYIITFISSIAIYYYKNIAILFIVIYLWTITIIQNKKDEIKIQMYGTIKNQRIIEKIQKK